MNSQDFCYWLQGFLEMGDPKELNESQVKMLKQHLNLVFVNVTGIVPPEPPGEPKKEILTATPTDTDRAARDKLRKEMLDRIDGTTRWGFWDREPTSYCSATGVSISGRGAKIC